MAADGLDSDGDLPLAGAALLDHGRAAVVPLEVDELHAGDEAAGLALRRVVDVLVADLQPLGGQAHCLNVQQPVARRE